MQEKHIASPRVVIAGTHSGSGKTSVVTALLSALTRRGMPVQPYKVGPDYIDPAFHSFVTGRASRNLDSWLLDAAALREVYRKNAPEAGAGLSLIEGVMGLFDGKGATHAGSTAHVAELLDAPVVLIINARGLSRSAAAMVAGYAAFYPHIRVAGVICNMVKSERQYALIRESVEQHCGIPCLGYLPEDARFALRSRHLGLVPAEEVAALETVVAALGDAASETMHIDALLDIAGAAPPLPAAAPYQYRSGRFPVRLGIARDAAFSFYYQDNLDLLRIMGAEPVFFSPLDDAAIPPDIHGLYFGGGFPEVFADRLSGNTGMRRSVLENLRAGMPAYAECGGMAYLCETLTDARGNAYPMVAYFPERVVMTGKLQKFGYAEAEFSAKTILGPAGTRVRTHEFHYSRLEPDHSTAGCLRMRKDGTEPWGGGLFSETVLAAYPHIHFYSNPDLAANFLRCCSRFRRHGEPGQGGT